MSHNFTATWAVPNVAICFHFSAAIHRENIDELKLKCSRHLLARGRNLAIPAEERIKDPVAEVEIQPVHLTDEGHRARTAGARGVADILLPAWHATELRVSMIIEPDPGIRGVRAPALRTKL
jgi:hypothetical protein